MSVYVSVYVAATALKAGPHLHSHPFFTNHVGIFKFLRRQLTFQFLSSIITFSWIKIFVLSSNCFTFFPALKCKKKKGGARGDPAAYFQGKIIYHSV